MSDTANQEKINALLDQAFDAFEQGRLAQATDGFQAVLKLDPKDFDALNMLGVLTLQKRDWPAAIALFEQAIDSDPEVGMAHTNLGLACVEAGQVDKALVHFDKAVTLEPSVEAHFGRGVAQQTLRQWEAASDSFAKVIAMQPQNVEAHVNRGTVLLQCRRVDEALACYNKALALQPKHVSALINRGHTLLALHRFDEALASYDQAIALDATRPGAFNGRGDACLGKLRFEEALAAYERALSLKADQPEVLCNRGNALQKLGRPSDAIASYEQALKLAPEHAIALANLSGALRQMHRHEEALQYADRALVQDDKLAGAHMNRGNALLDMERLNEASASFATAVSLQPDDVDMQWALGWSSLLAGDWARGLPLFEVRWRKPGFSSQPRGFTQPLWLGDTDIQGRTILLHAEQGLGDTLQFCRYVPMVVARGARVILEVQPPLKKLMASLVGGVQIVGTGEPLPAFDLQCPLMSLPLAFKSTPDTVPAPASYLSADAAQVQAVAQRLGPRTQPRIGLVWSGNAAHRNDLNRSMPLATLLSALPGGVQYHCLQKDIRESDMAVLKNRPDVSHMPDLLQSFDGTAALLDQMDLVISVDTSLAHLAGALGKPCWILLSRAPDWRWLVRRQDCPWYPSARLFRQQAWGQWDQPLREIAQALPTWLEAR